MAETIGIPELCRMHQWQLVSTLQLGPKDPWRAAMVVVSIAMFQVAAADQRVWERCPVEGGGKRDAGGLTMVLAEIGCLGCFLEPQFDKVLQHAKRHGVSDLAAITRDGERMKTFVERVHPREG